MFAQFNPISEHIYIQSQIVIRKSNLFITANWKLCILFSRATFIFSPNNTKEKFQVHKKMVTSALVEIPSMLADIKKVFPLLQVGYVPIRIKRKVKKPVISIMISNCLVSILFLSDSNKWNSGEAMEVRCGGGRDG